MRHYVRYCGSSKRHSAVYVFLLIFVTCAMFGYVCGDFGMVDNDDKKGIHKFGCSLVRQLCVCNVFLLLMVFLVTVLLCQV